MRLYNNLFFIISSLVLASTTVCASPTGYPVGSVEETAQIQEWKAEMDEKYNASEMAKQEALEALLSRIEAGEFDNVEEDKLVVQLEKESIQLTEK